MGVYVHLQDLQDPNLIESRAIPMAQTDLLGEVSTISHDRIINSG